MAETEALPALPLGYSEDDYKVDIEEEDASLPVKDGKRKLPVNMQKILKLESQGLTHAAIAEILGCQPITITRKLMSYRALKDKVNDFTARRADSLAFVQKMCIDSIEPAEIKALKVPQRIWVMGVLYDKERLERNKSTNNIAINIKGLTDSDKNMLAKMASDYATKAKVTATEERFDG